MTNDTVWQKRHALQIAAQLPDNPDDALLVLRYAKEQMRPGRGLCVTKTQSSRAQDADGPGCDGAGKASRRGTPQRSSARVLTPLQPLIPKNARVPTSPVIRVKRNALIGSISAT
jgi:hypothetical protein